MEDLINRSRLATLLGAKSELEWSTCIDQVCKEIGFDHFLVSLTRKQHSGQPYVRCSCFPDYGSSYESGRFPLIEGAAAYWRHHCRPLICKPERFPVRNSPSALAGEIRPGWRFGVLLPIHAPNGIQGMFFVGRREEPQGLEEEPSLECLFKLSLLRDLVSDTVERFLPDEGTAADCPALTPRETEVLRCIVEGKTSREISRTLCCSQSNIEFHIKNLRRKFRASSRRQVVVQAIAYGLVSPGNTPARPGGTRPAN